MVTDRGNAEQIRMIADQLVESAILHVKDKYPPTPESIIPAPLKWAAGIVSAVLTASLIGLGFWLVTTLSDLQQTVTRIDERQKTADPALSRRFDDIERRVGILESDRHGVMK